jgi:hypothetical protein
VAYFIPLYWVSHGKFPVRKCMDLPCFWGLDSAIQTHALGKEKRAAWAARFLGQYTDQLSLALALPERQGRGTDQS